MNKILLSLALLVSMTVPLAAQVPPPSPPQDRPVAVVGATIYTGVDAPIENGVILFEGGKIISVGTNSEVKIPKKAERIDATDKRIYAGFIESCSQIGLTEISSISATLDHTETGAVNSNVKAHVAVNPDSELIPVTRAGGVLLALSAPTGGLVSGKSAVIQLDGWTYEEMTVNPEAAMHINWPSSQAGRRRRGPVADEGTSVSDRVQQLRDLFSDARRYQQLRKEPQNQQGLDLRLEALAPVLDGSLPIMVRADQLNDIQSAVAFAVEQHARIIILGGYDAPLCAELLLKHDVPVVVSAVYRNPIRRGDPDDHAYSLPRRLHEAGIRFCISSIDRSESWNTRNLPFHAGTAMAFGLPDDEALKAITLYPAQILGIDDRVGSLESGKDATFFVCSGDPLDSRSTIDAVYIEGRSVDLSSRHTRLYEKYKQKYEQSGHVPGED